MAINPIDLPTYISVRNKITGQEFKIMLGGIGDSAEYYNAEYQISIPLEDGVYDHQEEDPEVLDALNNHSQ